ncbi:hypothetical protein BCR34DRAFT_654039 [Clohesyomyces aquaticus]|uniref:Uncharacterized protein n=1 Tax=Clohesyomyces aquaticus TaxID=1231657 RepID=A0A1Y1ZKS3_9PLEO|nr:hypothetical protein BCR34DRAFT_654039 [Clohesyomyces aquaticus]
MPLYFRTFALGLRFCQVMPFLSTFIDQGFMTIANNHTCTLHVSINESDSKHGSNPIIDLKSLVLFILDHPGVIIKFHGGESFG